MTHCTNERTGWPAPLGVSHQLKHETSCRRCVSGGSGTNGGSAVR